MSVCPVDFLVDVIEPEAGRGDDPAVDKPVSTRPVETDAPDLGRVSRHPVAKVRVEQVAATARASLFDVSHDSQVFFGFCIDIIHGHLPACRTGSCDGVRRTVHDDVTQHSWTPHDTQ